MDLELILIFGVWLIGYYWVNRHYDHWRGPTVGSSDDVQQQQRRQFGVPKPRKDDE